MRTSVNSCLFCLATMIAGTCSPTLYAQGLIFNLPQDGTGVEYEGEIAYTTVRPDLAEGKETITKARELSIKSVGRENAEWDGQVQPCRWIEIKVNTGNAGEAGIDPGPVGSRIYKVLVPESKILNASSDNNGIPNIMLPIVKGYRRSSGPPNQRRSHRVLPYDLSVDELSRSTSRLGQRNAANQSGQHVVQLPASVGQNRDRTAGKPVHQ